MPAPGFASVLVAFGVVAAVVLLLARWDTTRELAVGLLVGAIFVVLLHNTEAITQWSQTISQLPDLQAKGNQ